MNDENKLPKWARDKLFNLRQEIAQLKLALAVAREQGATNGASGKVLVDHWETKFPLKDTARISFSMPLGRVFVMLREQGVENGPVLDINGTVPLRLLPRAANSVYVQLDP